VGEGVGLEIRSLIADEEIAACVPVIRRSFKTVAEEMGLTEANCPSHTSFMTYEKLKEKVEKGFRCFGLFEHGRTPEQAGFVGAFRASEELYYLEKLAVLPELRHKGYGRMLVDHVFAFAGENGGKRISITLIDENVLLKRWYLDYGFRQTDLKKFPHLPFTVCFMEKEIR
jgi:ribosomal protein S18 acetylase RimI-like enzyme